MAAKEKTGDLEHLDQDRSRAQHHPVGTGLGKGMAHAVNHDEEDAYWREHHVREPYYNPDRSAARAWPKGRLWKRASRSPPGERDQRYAGKHQPTPLRQRNSWSARKQAAAGESVGFVRHPVSV